MEKVSQIFDNDYGRSFLIFGVDNSWSSHRGIEKKTLSH